MPDLTGEEYKLAEEIIGETEYEPEADHDFDFREQSESSDRWHAAEEDKYLSSFSE